MSTQDWTYGDGQDERPIDASGDIADETMDDANEALPCPKCGAPLVSNERYAGFAHGTSPANTLSVKLRASWCIYTPSCNHVGIELIPVKTARMP